jgi:hypothetical protein
MSIAAPTTSGRRAPAIIVAIALAFLLVGSVTGSSVAVARGRAMTPKAVALHDRRPPLGRALASTSRLGRLGARRRTRANPAPVQRR